MVSDKLQRYLFQVRRMLCELISVDNRVVSIEYFVSEYLTKKRRQYFAASSALFVYYRLN